MEALLIPKVLPSEKFNFKTEPFQHQIEAFNYAMENKGFLLGDEQGLGKTKQSIDIAVARKNEHGFKHCLIVCGVNGSRFNWVREVTTHSNEKSFMLGRKIGSRGKVYDGSTKDKLADLDKDIKEFFIITNVESMGNEDIQEKLKELTENGTIGMVIIDEFHKAKNPEGKRGRGIHKLNPQFKLALTGTPLMNQPLDLYNIMKWLGVIKCAYYTFKNVYCDFGGKGGYAITGYKNLADLRRRFEPVMLRRKKEDVLDLPEKIRTTEYIEMTPKQKQLYAEVRECILANINQIKLSPNPLAQLIRLRQVTAHTSILSHTIYESAKFDRLEELVEEIVANDKKAIIYSNWTNVTDILYEKLEKYNPAIVTGAVSDREGQMDKFQNDESCKVIVGTIPALGTAFTLTAASYVIFMDKPWNPANTEQAEDRAHRIGQTNTLQVITLACKDTIDERIEEIIEEKAELVQGLIEGDDDVISRLNIPTEELLDRLLF